MDKTCVGLIELTIVAVGVFNFITSIKYFGFDYDDYIFTNKNFIEEVARIM